MRAVENYQARRVVTGVGADGRSTVVSDDYTSTRIATPTLTAAELWQLDAVPASTTDAETLTGQVTLEPSPGGLVARMVCFPPDSEWKGSDGAFDDARAAIIGADDSFVEGEVEGLHLTNTVDLITVVEGEIVAVLEATETVLRVGDTLIQRATKHAWSNRTSEPATILAVLISAR